MNLKNKTITLIIFLLTFDQLLSEVGQYKVVFIKPTCFYANTIKDSPCIFKGNPNEEYDIEASDFNHDVRNNTNGWIRVKVNNQIYFLESKSLNFSIFTPVSKNLMYVSKPLLEVRNTPDFDSELLLNLKEGDQIYTLSKSVFQYDNGYFKNHWFKVIDKSNNVGYVFGAYISEDEILSNENENFDYRGKEFAGFVKFKNLSAVTYRSPGLLVGYKQSEFCNGEKEYFEESPFNLLKIQSFDSDNKQKYAKITKIRKKDKEEYFLVEYQTQYKFDGGIETTCYDFWINKKSVEFYKGNFSEWNLKKYGKKFPSAFIKFINKESIDFKNTNLIKIKKASNKTKKEFYILDKHIYSKNFSLNRNHSFNILELNNGKFNAKFDYFDFDDVKIKDLNNDGNEEIIVTDQFSELIKLTIYQIVEDNIQEILIIDYKPYETENCIITASLPKKKLNLRKQVIHHYEMENRPCWPNFNKNVITINQIQESFEIFYGYVKQK